MRKTPRWAGTAAALFAAFQIAACESPTGPEVLPPGGTKPDTTQTPPPPPPLRITTVEAVIGGQSVSFTGQNLRSITELRVDGRTVSFEILSDTSGRFTAPAEAACDIDGRAVEIIANTTARATGSLRVSNAVRLEVGEARLLSAQQLACIQLPAGAEEFLFAAASHTGEKIVDDVFRLLTASPGAAQGSAVAGSLGIAGLTGHAHGGHEHLALTEASLARAANAPAAQSTTPFYNYADAQVGDDVIMVDWDNPAVLSATKLDELPTFVGRVVAVTPGQMFVVDLRVKNASVFDSPVVREKFRAAGEIADKYMLRALQAVIDPSLQLPQEGAAGRMMNIITTLPAGIAGTVRGEEIVPRLGASHMFASRLSSTLADWNAEGIAGVVIHEAAHIADAYDSYRNGGKRSAGWYMEAVAVSVEDMAARMAMGNVRPDMADMRDGVPSSGIRFGPSFTAPTHSPWGAAGSSIGAGGPGAYDRGARILRYAQQKAGQLGFLAAGETLHQKLVREAPRWQDGFEAHVRAFNVDAIARAVGMSARDLLEESMLADLTDGQVAPEAASRFGLPRNEAWNQTQQAGGLPPFRVLSRGATLDEQVRVPAGGYAYWYIEGGTQGLSLQAENVVLKDHNVVHLMRLR
jgi:hypothetical protein